MDGLARPPRGGSRRGRLSALPLSASTEGSPVRSKAASSSWENSRRRRLSPSVSQAVGRSSGAWRSPGNRRLFRLRSHASSEATARRRRPPAQRLEELAKAPPGRAAEAGRAGVASRRLAPRGESRRPGGVMGVVGTHSLLGSVWRLR